MPHRRVDPRVAVVTGGGSGIGRAVALALARNGYTVVIAGRRPDALRVTQQMAKRGQVTAVPTDVTDRASVGSLFKIVQQTFGRLDLLFNNAGIHAAPSPLEDLSLDVWSSVVETNLTGPFLCTQEAFRLMKSQQPRGGRIINNGSISAYAPRPMSVAYTASKHAITGLTKSTALDGRAFDIACGQIDIGNAATDMTGAGNASSVQSRGDAHPEPLIDVEYVAQAVVYMASLPLSANVLFMTLMATKMPFVGRG